MIYETCLNGIKIFAYHGLYEAERILGAEFIVDVKVIQHLDDDKVILTIEQAVNYEKIYTVILDQMKVTENLIETVAQRILSKLKLEFEQASNIHVTIHKPNAGGLLPSGQATVRFQG
jgi:dihydroneopterin aldolase